MLLLENSGSQRVLVITVEDRHCLLHNDGAMIRFLIPKVARKAGNFYSVTKGLFLRFESGKRRQQRRMNVENLARELLHEPWREQTHISRQADEINPVLR